MQRPRGNHPDDYSGPRITRATVSPVNDPTKVIEMEIANVRGGAIIVDGLPIGPWLLMTPGAGQIANEWATLGLRRHGGIEEEEYEAIRNCGGSREEKRMLVLALVSQIAAESMVNDYKAANSLWRWAGKKFREQRAETNFDTYWTVIEQVSSCYQNVLPTRPLYYRDAHLAPNQFWYLPVLAPIR